jgi:CBS domain-containing protein
MNVAATCCKAVITVDRRDEILTAARLMREHHVGFLVVVEPGAEKSWMRPIGVLTDRDIVISVVAPEADPRSLTVGDVMTENPVIASLTDSIDTTICKMQHFGVRRLPVVGAHGELKGVLSLDDLVRSLSVELGGVAGAIDSEQRIERAIRT